MKQTIISYGLEERDLPGSAAELAAFWIEDLVYAAEYWSISTAKAAVDLTLGALRRPRLLVAMAALSAGSVLALGIRNQLALNQQRVASMDLRAIATGVELYQHDTGELPARLEDLKPNYLRELHTDPWGSNYVTFQGRGGFAVVSAGHDGVLGTEDDLVRVIPKL